MTKILVVDPGRSLRDLLRHILSSAGHSVVEEKDGRSAFDKAVYERRSGSWPEPPRSARW